MSGGGFIEVRVEERVVVESEARGFLCQLSKNNRAVIVKLFNFGDTK